MVEKLHIYQTMTLTFDHLWKLNKYNYLFCELCRPGTKWSTNSSFLVENIVETWVNSKVVIIIRPEHMPFFIFVMQFLLYMIMR